PVTAGTCGLFASIPYAPSLPAANLFEVDDLILSTGFYRSKARNIFKLADDLVETHDGVVPDDMDALVKLAGVGRKTANVVLGNAFDTPGLTVDTHMGRLARRCGWTDETDPGKAENDVAALFRRMDVSVIAHRVILRGRRIGHARRPACGPCPLTALCPSCGTGELDPEKARSLLRFEMSPEATSQARS